MIYCKTFPRHNSNQTPEVVIFSYFVLWRLANEILSRARYAYATLLFSFLKKMCSPITTRVSFENISTRQISCTFTLILFCNCIIPKPVNRVLLGWLECRINDILFYYYRSKWPYNWIDKNLRIVVWVEFLRVHN